MHVVMDIYSHESILYPAELVSSLFKDSGCYDGGCFEMGNGSGRRSLAGLVYQD